VLERIGGEPGFSPETALESLIWMTESSIATAEDLGDWLSLVEGLTEEQRNKAFGSSLGVEGSVVVGMRLPFVEGRKPAEQQDWDRVVEALCDLTRRAEALRLEALWAGAIRSTITVLAQRKSDLGATEAVARAGLQKPGISTSSEFLIRTALGEAYVNKMRWDEGAAELVTSLNLAVEGFPFERFNALLSCSFAVGQSDARAALKHTREAVSLANETDHFPETETAKALCELAIAEWLAGSIQGSFAAFDRAGDLLFAQTEQIERGEDLMLLFGHCAGYVCQIATKGQPPDTVADGSPWLAPQRGVFLTEYPGRAAYYQEREKTRPRSMEMTLLAMFAEGVGNHERAVYWALRGVDASRAVGMTISQSVLGEITIP
jgi:hypothetical protein